MYSKARIAGHPIHPMLIALPIGLYVATVGALLGYVGTEDPFYFRMALVTNVAGVLAAVVAAIPGAIDLFSLPRYSQARMTGIKHASFALLATGLFAVSGAVSWRQWDSGSLDATGPLAIGVVGLLALVVAGALGWSMVQTHRVGVRPTFTKSRSIPEAIDEFEEIATPPPVSNGHGGDHYFRQ